MMGQTEVKCSREGGEAELISRSLTGATNLAGNSCASRLCVLTRPFGVVCSDLLLL